MQRLHAGVSPTRYCIKTGVGNMASKLSQFLHGLLFNSCARSRAVLMSPLLTQNYSIMELYTRIIHQGAA
ncbi:hypothetical protein [Moorena sp. SIO3H5]|uniref:hypothetical protein n=1 Tax=Moorena sp. SIO3H5 TaxID=2607834 RepID=UPI0013BA6C2B|nr:hypothetical protein [Moorena sp. SIO3H5]NEO72572.1 hypothetical protein [Moorena sp. SIO3H5]